MPNEDKLCFRYAINILLEQRRGIRDDAKKHQISRRIRKLRVKLSKLNLATQRFNILRGEAMKEIMELRDLEKRILIK